MHIVGPRPPQEEEEEEEGGEGGGGAIDERLLLFAATGGHVPAALVPMCNADQLLERVLASIYVSSL